MKKGGSGKKKYLSLKGGERGGWRAFELNDTQKVEIQKTLVKAGIPRQPASKFDCLFARIENLVNQALITDKQSRAESLPSREIKQEIGRLRESADHLLENLLLLYGDNLHSSVETALDAELDPDFRIDNPSVFIQRLKVDLMALSLALQRVEKNFKIQRGRPYHPKGLKTFLAIELARIFHGSLGITPTCTVDNEDAQTKDSPFVVLLHRVYKLCDLDITDVKPYALKAIHDLK